MHQVFDIPYIPDELDPLRSFDVHVPPDCPPHSPVLVFVHGGAWQADDKAAHRPLAERLALLSHCPVLVPNYRLTTPDTNFQHPRHAEDVLAFLAFLTTWEGLPAVRLHATRPLFLLGHSAGAHILAAILLDSDAATPSLAPPPSVRAAVRGAVLSEGIYDLDALLERFPAYRAWFVAPAFGARASYADVSVVRLPLRQGDSGSDMRWLIVHSTGDTLVDGPQSAAMAAHLRALYGPDAETRVQCSLDELHVEHDDAITTPLFLEMVCAFVQSGE
ncbi:Alpha/Beta hydrolase protein [Mycena pura]|uniref:Alpha/Beta hydrolase protein n=1 Tax=Mycena pura TaxID=153505 RepID=A0AAD6VPF2_9AGAR|nr:Alpha/Beta hydrolase protein [Mycena pura]